MRFAFILILSILTVSCSGDTEKNPVPSKTTAPIKNKDINPLKPQLKPVEEHISGGGGQLHVSGSSTSTHISGQ
ncbi:MAG: hypothetical protein HOK41_01760 [Nitrospina sp.]|jgi:PBP1b-binding outer membrane lipoprotein LpoB|nr:hypothetical protein [Nitrospina sp.]